MRLWPMALMVFALSAMSLNAFSEPLSEHKAKVSFEAGQRAFNRGDYSRAAGLFERAARWKPHPAAFLDAAEAWALAGDPVRAAELCDHVLGMSNIEERYRRKASDRLQALEKQLFTLHITGRRGTNVRVDGGALRPLPAVVRLEPGVHRVVAIDQRGREQSMEVTGARGTSSRLVVLPQPAPSPTPAPGGSNPTAPSAKAPPAKAPATKAPSPKRASGPSVASWVLWSGAAVGGVTAAVGGVLTLQARDRFNREPTVAHADAFDHDKLLTNLSLGVAGALAVGGALVWWASPGPVKERASVWMCPERGGATVGFANVF